MGGAPSAVPSTLRRRDRTLPRPLGSTSPGAATAGAVRTDLATSELVAPVPAYRQRPQRVRGGWRPTSELVAPVPAYRRQPQRVRGGSRPTSELVAPVPAYRQRPQRVRGGWRPLLGQ